ncbi:MAG: YegP family protein [Gemmataceae bacterium]
MTGKYELMTKNGKFHFHLKAGNGQVILTSQVYHSKAAAKIGIESVKKNGGAADRYDRRQSKNDHPYFVLLAANKEIIGASQMYSSKSSMENGIKSVRKNAAKATVVECEE